MSAEKLKPRPRDQRIEKIKPWFAVIMVFSVAVLTTLSYFKVHLEQHSSKTMQLNSLVVPGVVTLEFGHLWGLHDIFGISVTTPHSDTTVIFPITP